MSINLLHRVLKQRVRAREYDARPKVPRISRGCANTLEDGLRNLLKPEVGAKQSPMSSHPYTDARLLKTKTIARVMPSLST